MSKRSNISKEETPKHYDSFQKMANRYDLSNDVIFFGAHRIWRNRLADTVAPSDDTKIIDMAAGTGSSALALVNYIKKNQIKNCHITLCDVNENMLEVAKKKLKSANYDLVNFVKDDAENSSFKNDTFDVYTITFGVRCCINFEKVLKEAYRILKPGGKFVYMDFGRVKNPIIRWIGFFYVYYIMPWLSYFVHGSRVPCKLLIKTVENFLEQDAWNRIMEDAGFQTSCEDRWFGLIAIHIGVKPKGK